MRDRGVLYATIRALVEAEFPPTITADVLSAVGLDPDEVYGQPSSRGDRGAATGAIRRRSGSWPAQILQAWDRQCAFCGYDGQLGTGSVGLEAAHVRWFNFDGPDALDTGLALCSLHHKLFDRGALGLTHEHRIRVSSSFTARSAAGRRIYDLADQPLRPRPATTGVARTTTLLQQFRDSRAGLGMRSPMFTFIARVRGTTSIWGSRDVESTMTAPLVLVLNNDSRGDDVLIRTEKPQAAPVLVGTLKPGECWTLMLTGLRAVTGTCTTDSTLACAILYPA